MPLHSLLLLPLPLVMSIEQCCQFKGINFTIDQTKRPHLDTQAWWGREEMEAYQDTSIRRFRIEFSDEMISDLRHCIHNHRFAPSLLNSSFTYGFNTLQLDPWLKYWSEEYDFKAREKFFNQFPMFKTNIQGLDVHFLWVKPNAPPHIEIIPLLMLHGWGSSIRGLYGAISLITGWEEGMDFAVEVIAPSLPGFGYSESSLRPGFGGPEMAVLMRNLMRRLGFQKFYVQGNDVGSVIGSDLATLFPDEVLGFHTTLPVVLSRLAVLLHIVGSIEPTLVVEPGLVNRMYPLSRVGYTLMLELGYMHQQATRPDTLGFGLSDSPAGLLTWIMEKFSIGTKPSNRLAPDGGLSNFKKEHMIDNIMMYWVPNTITTSMRFYADTLSLRSFGLGVDSYPTPVPTWALQPSADLVYHSSLIISMKYPNLLNVTALNVGGHFLTFELPEIVSDDVLMALKGFWKWHQRNQYRSPSLDDASVRKTYKNLSRTSRRLAKIAKSKGNGYSEMFWLAQCLLDKCQGNSPIDIFINQ